MIPLVIPEVKERKYVEKNMQNTANEFQKYWSI